MVENFQSNKIAHSEDKHEIGQDGSFQRQSNHFTTPFGSGENELPVEAGRYHILWTPICPWAHRQIIVRQLLGLEDVFSVGEAYPVRTDKGWDFRHQENKEDEILKIKYIPEIYASTDPHYHGRATVPVIVDIKEHKVVNNDYHNMTYYWEKEFAPFHKEGAPDLLPSHQEAEIKEFNQWLFDNVNNGVYKCGFAKQQAAYETAYDQLFESLDKLEERLSQHRYLFGNQITDSDIRLYVTLARFDAAYYSNFRTNRNRIRDFDNLWNYAKDLYNIPAFKETTDFEAIKKGYSLGNVSSNPYQLLAKGPDNSDWENEHDRHRFNK